MHAPLRAQETPPPSPDATPGDLSAAEVPATRRAVAIRPMLSPGEYIESAAYLRRRYSKPFSEWPKPELDTGVTLRELGKISGSAAAKSRLQREPKESLGEMLFFDPRLSGGQQIACAGCHDPELNWADGRSVAVGNHRQALKRNTPSLLNAGLGSAFFWDGRAASLEAQAHDVILNAKEMRGAESEVKERLSALEEYQKRFSAVFGDAAISLDRVAEAIAAFERTIVSRGNSFDRFLDGETEALSDSAVRGLHLFRTNARCINCHNGPNFTDAQFHDLGLSFYGRKLEDLGRYLQTGRAEDVGAFKTPSLRNVARTAPYMHNGLFELDGVLRLYNAGMPTLKRAASQKDDPLFPAKDKLLRPLGLNQQDLTDLKAFLESLTEAPFRFAPPDLPAFVD